ncbi:DUF6602 domain-containing protein [Priestia megaterium]
MRDFNYLAYHKSITDEFKAIQNRVRYFINGSHWGEDGRFKEILLMNHLKKVLPSNVSVGTGFVRNKEEITTQIDIIIYDSSIPAYFSEGDFVIVHPESVIGIIEVKSKVRADNKLFDAIKKANENGKIIGKQNIFNGIFSYENSINFSVNSNLSNGILQTLLHNNGYINHISFGEDIFMKYWAEGNPQDEDELRCFSFYSIEHLSFGYFISNLIELANLETRNVSLNEELEEFLYPIREGKETKRLRNLEIKLPSVT